MHSANNDRRHHYYAVDIECVSFANELLKCNVRII